MRETHITASVSTCCTGACSARMSHLREAQHTRGNQEEEEEEEEEEDAACACAAYACDVCVPSAASTERERESLLTCE